MFVTKQNPAQVAKKSTSVAQSTFVKAAQKQSAKTVSGNGAVKYSKLDDPLCTQFGILGSYKAPRSFQDIQADCELLWSLNSLQCVLFMFYIRMITRVTQLFNGDNTSVSQKGAELRHEGIMRMIWLSVKSPDVFWRNIEIYIAISSWKDIITMLQYDLVYNGWNGRVLNWDNFGQLLMEGLSNKNTCELVKKYLPQIRANSQCTTIEAQADNQIAKWICSLLFGVKEDTTGWTYKKYRKLKSAGTAHQWQQLISRGQFDHIDFAKIHGRALNLLVRSKFLKNHGLEEKYQAWITKPETKEVKYTGFVHELFEGLPNTLTRLSVGGQETINKQFQTLIEKGGKSEQSKLICVRDTSGSMGSACTGTKLSCYNVAKALALYFSEFLTGAFSNAWIEFNSTAQMHTWAGTTPLEKWFNDHSSYVGSTNFQSVIQLFCSLRANGLPEADFPVGILMISDGELNKSSMNETNVETAKRTMLQYFSKEYVDNFIMCMWNLQSNHYGPSTGKKFETYEAETPNCFYFSGFSASVISFLTGKIMNQKELLAAALNQEILQLVKLD